jgi:hypothetical protein
VQNFEEFRPLLQYTRVSGWDDDLWAAMPNQFPVPFFWFANTSQISFLTTLSHTQILKLKLGAQRWWRGVLKHHAHHFASVIARFPAQHALTPMHFDQHSAWPSLCWPRSWWPMG